MNALPAGKPQIPDLILDAHRSIEETARELAQMRGALKHMLFQIDQQEANLKTMLIAIEDAWPSEEEQAG